MRSERFNGDIWEPACGDGAMSRELAAAGHTVISTDLVDRGYGEADEPPRVCRRLFGLSHAAIAGWSNVA
jgi:hypothetical protein